MLTLSQLKFEMRRYAGEFSGKKVDDNKSLENYLSDAGSGTATPRRIYKSFIKYILESNGHTLKPWRRDWVNKSINALAPELL